ncbi:MAG: PAS domain-containing protein [Ferrovibrio sp.]|uniref:PAS domain-containing protein n=1 Tax=Ferrovibrio sp. TaxID=1917215 RepID=UPI0026304C5B|nr:PAS domain-containing protein [Ferrovibrio sp.]MCW0233572.1 PAS domain-containing protein [Ferrovibrio sp.]
MQGHSDIAGENGQVAPPGEWPGFRDSRFMLLLQHWAANRNGLMMPRAALDPAAIKTCLPHVWLFQYLAESDSFLCRLSGEQVNEAWGVNMAGKQPQEFMPPESAAMAHLIYRRILLTPALHVGHRRIAPAGRQAKLAERLVVPLSDAEGRPYGIFGLSLYYFDPITQAELPPHVGPEVTYYPCAGLPAGLP